MKHILIWAMISAGAFTIGYGVKMWIDMPGALTAADMVTP